MAYAGIGGLPGRILKRDLTGLTCESCAHRDDKEVPATICVQGETDSFGFEEVYLCQKHHEEFFLVEEKPASHHCEWCKKGFVGVFTTTRDPDEGSHGPVYQVCPDCAGRADNYGREDDLSLMFRCPECAELREEGLFHANDTRNVKSLSTAHGSCDLCVADRDYLGG